MTRSRRVWPWGNRIVSRQGQTERYWTGITEFTSFVPAVKMWTTYPEKSLPKRPRVYRKRQAYPSGLIVAPNHGCWAASSRPSALWRRYQRCAFQLRSLHQIQVLRGKRQSSAQCQLKIGRVVYGQSVRFARGENSFCLIGCEGRFHIDRENCELVPEQLRSSRLNALPAKPHQQSVRYFRRPVRGNCDSIPTAKAVKQTIGPGGCFVLKTPGECHRSIRNERCHQYLWPS